MEFVFNLSTLLAAWVVLNLVGLLQAQRCGQSWTRVGVRCYKVFKYSDPDNEDRTWHFANDRCEAYGGYLACINDETEDDEVNYIRKKAGIPDESYYWIGLTDSLFEGKFLWVDGTVAGFTKWLHPLEPNSQNPTDQIARHEDYVVASGSKNWSDVRADWTAVIRDRPEPSGYVCETDLLMLPGPPGVPGSSGPAGQQGHTGQKGDTGPPGPIGVQGAQGEPGPKGDTGLPGSTGATGPSGPQGKTGRIGPRGYSGLIGPPGIRGPSGPQGLPGDPGLTGLRGLQGPTGPTGLDGWPGGPGEKGERGEKGLQGDPGFLGPTGQAGRDGLPGLRGPDGQPGEKGETGAPGVTGAMGPSGYPGLPGDKGQQGSQGLPGIRGEPGQKGEKGDVGDQGAPGPTGKQGLEGLPGRNGYAGARGLVGLPGSRGLPGIAGAKGQRGDKGEQGNKGETGDGGPPGLRGPIGLVGQRGEKGVVGDKGPTGDYGPRGPQGAAGPPGPPGPPGSMMDHGLPTFVHTDQPGEVSRYINASAFCSARGSGVYSHPLHCWQFVVCGQTFGGSFELTCYAGRRFDPQSRKCVVDNGCIFGSLSYNKTRSTKTSKLFGVDGKNGEEVSRLERDVSIHTGVAGLLIIVVTVLAVVVCRLYVNRNRSLTSQHVQHFGDDVSIISNREITDRL